MNNHPDKPIFNTARVGALLVGFGFSGIGFLRLGIRWIGAIAVKGNHGVFHASGLPCINRLRDRVGVVEGKSAVDIHGMDDRLRRIL